MTRFAPIAAALVVAAGPISSAVAQPQPPFTPRPTFSPYLGLLAGRGNPAFNYLGVVRPQMQFQQQNLQLQMQLQQTTQGLQALTGIVYGEDPRLGQTGHPVVFNNTAHFFSSHPTLGGAPRVGSYGGGVGAGTVPSFGNLPGGFGGVGANRPGGGPQNQNFTRPGGSALGARRSGGAPKR